MTQVRLTVEVDPRWVELPVQDDTDALAWAGGAVQEALRLRGLREPAPVVEVYTGTWAALAEQVRGRAVQDGAVVVGAYGLLGEVDLLPVTVAELAVVRWEEGLDRFVDGLVVPADQRFAPPDVQEVATASGPAVRLQQLRVVEEGPERDASVQTSVVHVWPGPEEHLVTVLTAWYDSPVDAEVTSGVLGGLAASLRVVR